MANVVPNIWSQMNYTPPRGQCNYKQSIVSQKCPCLRFMLHPLKSTSSYECDGCTHHASFHNMENKVEDEIRKRWEQEAKDKADQEAAQSRPKKRIRAIEYNTSANSHATEDDDFEIVSGFASNRSSDGLREANDKANREKETRSRPKTRAQAMGFIVHTKGANRNAIETGDVENVTGVTSGGSSDGLQPTSATRTQLTRRGRIWIPG